MKVLLKNPLTLWLRWLMAKVRLEFKHRDKCLRIEYLALLKGCTVGRSNRIYDNSILTQVDLGDFSYVNANCNINHTKIGKFCSIGQHVKCGLGAHPARGFVSTHPIFYSTMKQCGANFVSTDKFHEIAPVEIGNDVWIGCCAIIRDGVKIGDGAIVAAGAVVVEDVQPYAVVGGVPAKLIRYRFDEDTINKLTLLKWWDKDINWIKDRLDLFCNINDFLERAE